MPTDTSSRLIALALLIFIAVVTTYFSRDAQACTWFASESVESFGAFELVTRGSKLAGTDYALRYRGKAFEFEGKAGMFGGQTARYEVFNAMFTFSPGTPAILVNVGNPNNDSFFYLLRDIDGKASAQFVGQASSGKITAQWIDPPAAGLTSDWDDRRHRGRLAGGRWLLVGEFIALDMQTLTAYPLARPDGTSINDWVPVIATAPDRLSFVRFGDDHPPKRTHTLLVFGLTNGTVSMVPIRPRVERFNTRDDINLAWFNHYYQWQSHAGLPDRLIARPNAKPRPYHGDQRVSGLDPNNHEYQLMGVAGGMREAVLAYLLNVEGGKRLPDSPRGAASVTIGGKTVRLSPQVNQLTLWMETSTDSALITQIGKRFDAVLATGVHDALFYP